MKEEEITERDLVMFSIGSHALAGGLMSVSPEMTKLIEDVGSSIVLELLASEDLKIKISNRFETAKAAYEMAMLLKDMRRQEVQ